MFYYGTCLLVHINLKKLLPLRSYGRIDLILNKVLKRYYQRQREHDDTLKGKETCGDYRIDEVLLSRKLNNNNNNFKKKIKITKTSKMK